MHSGQFATLEAVVDFYDQGGGTVPDGGVKPSMLVPLALTRRTRPTSWRS